MDMVRRSVEVQRILGGARVCTMGLCARKTAEFSELQRVGCHVAMALGVAGDAALSPRLDCVMEKAATANYCLWPRVLEARPS